MPEPTYEDFEVWRRFRAGESASQIAQGFDGIGDVGVSTVLRIVLLVELEMGTSPLFFEMEYDEEGCPNPVKKKRVYPPGTQNDDLERWLRDRI